ncbi:MAG: 2-phospho-L-lactate transferase CofD family protein, partial [bacterium]
VMTQPGETDGYTASAHAAQLIKLLGANSIDVILLNRTFPARLIEKYKEQGALPVKIDADGLKKKLGIRRVIQDDLIMEDDKVRHNPGRLASRIIAILKEERPSANPALPAELDRLLNLFRA